MEIKKKQIALLSCTFTLGRVSQAKNLSAGQIYNAK
jgi:hypothetical protein